MPIRPILRRACALVLLLASAASAQLAFSSAPIFPPVPLAQIADVNGDGWLDACGREYGCPAVHPGLADGTFGEPIGTSGYLADGFVLGDVNGDGRADLVAPHAFSGSTSALDVRLATQDATFLEASILSLPRDPGELMLEDVSDDGVLDLVVMPAKLSIKRFMLLLGHGDGTFDAPQDWPTLGAHELAFGDLNGDQHTDIVLNVIKAGTPTSELTALFGEGAGQFGPPVSLYSGSVPGFEMGDVLGVRRASIVTRGSGEVRVLTLQPHVGLEELLVPVPGVVPFQTLHVRQVVGGGPLEIIIRGEIDDGGPNTVLVNDGAGSFSASPEYWAPVNGLATVADANHDGAQDIVTTAGIVRGQGDGSFEPWYGLPAKPFDLDAADVSGDGRPDVVTTFGDLPALLHLGRLDGTLAPPVALDLGPAPIAVRLLDVAGSPATDALTLHMPPEPGSEHLLGVSIGQGDGTFAPPVLTPVGLATEMAVADIDADGRVDVLPWPGTLVLLNAGNGSWTPLSAPSSLYVLQEAAGDFDGDGHVDLVRLLKQPANILMRQVLLGHGDGTFTPLTAVSIGTTGSETSLTAVHLDADGKLDLAFLWGVPMWSPAKSGLFLTLFPGNGDGTFGTPQFVEQSATPLFVDLTGDGHVDLLTADLVAIEGSAAGLTDHVVESPAPLMLDIVMADFDGDGVSDVAGIGWDGLMILPRASGVWHELQHSLAGSQGYSKLQGVGSLQPASAVHLLVKHVPPATPVFVVLGLQAANLPLHGGVLVPSPDVIVGGLLTDGDGELTLAAHWPPGVPAGTELFAQAWYLEGAGWGATHAVVGTTPR